MTTHKINDREYLFLEVPENASLFTITGGYIFGNRRVEVEWRVFHAHGSKMIAERGSGRDYTILGIASELTEEQAEELVESIHVEHAPSPYNDFGGGYSYAFVDYENRGEYAGWNGDAGYYNKATESLHSLITSLGLNPERTLIIERKK